MHHVKPNDFLYMWQGKPRQTLSKDQAHCLSPVSIKGTAHQRALLLLHGFSSSPAVYRQFIPAFTHYDALICPVLPGHGSNLEDFANTKASEWLFAVESICGDLMAQYKSVDVMGLSLGGVLACHLANIFPLHHLYLLAPALSIQLNIRLTQYGIRMLQWLGVKHVNNHAGTIRGQKHWELAYRKLPLTTVFELLAFIDTFTLTPPTCPTDLFLGRHDNVVDVSSVAIKFGRLSNVTLHWLENSAHVLPLDDDAQRIISCVTSET